MPQCPLKTCQVVLQQYKCRRYWYISHTESLNNYSGYIRNDVAWVFDNPHLRIQAAEIRDAYEPAPEQYRQFARTYLAILNQYDPSSTDPFITIADQYFEDNLLREIRIWNATNSSK